MRLGVEQQPRQVDAVAAHVVERAATDLEDVADVGRVVVVVAEPRLDGDQPPDPAAGDELADLLPRRMQAIHERLGQQHALPARRRATMRAASRGVHRQRLLAQDVLPARAAAIAHSACRWLGSGM